MTPPYQQLILCNENLIIDAFTVPKYIMFPLISFLCMAIGCANPEVASKNTTSRATNNAYSDIEVETLKKRHDKESLLIIDVRTKNEFSKGHIPTAINIPLAELYNDSSLSKYKNTEIFLVCAVGGRSKKAQRFLISKGFDNTVNVVGGTDAWLKNDFPVEK